MKNFRKGLSKTFEKGLSKRFETFSKVEGYAKHTPTLRKPKFRFSMIRFLAVLYGKGFEYRALQGIMRGLSRHFYDFPVISFSQIRRRMLELPLSFNAKADDLVVGIDGSGMKVSNRGEWIRQAWGIRRGWIKVVILGDSEGNIVDIRVGNEDLDERSSGRGLLRKNGRNIKKAMMDGMHDCKDTFNLCNKLGIDPAIKIRDNASEKGLSPRAREVRFYRKKGSLQKLAEW